MMMMTHKYHASIHPLNIFGSFFWSSQFFSPSVPCFHLLFLKELNEQKKNGKDSTWTELLRLCWDDGHKFNLRQTPVKYYNFRTAFLYSSAGQETKELSGDQLFN